MQCPRCQHENRPNHKFCAECGTPVAGTDPIVKSYAELKDEIDGLRRSLTTDLRPVSNAVAESATRFCAAYDALIFQLDGDLLRRVAHHGPISSSVAHTLPVRGTVSGRAVLACRPIQVADLQAESASFQEAPRGLGRRVSVRS